jgi:hypothetical protein
MKIVIVLTGSRALLGMTEDLDDSPLLLLPTENALSDDEAEIIERNTGLAFMPIHYPHYIKTEIIGGIIDLSDPPANPLPKDEK